MSFFFQSLGLSHVNYIANKAGKRMFISCACKGNNKLSVVSAGLIVINNILEYLNMSPLKRNIWRPKKI